MAELPLDESSVAAAEADRGRRKAAAYEAHGAQSFAATSAPPATPIADTVEASRFRGSGHDVDIDAFGTDEGPLVAEVKYRRSGGVSVTEYDCLFLRRNSAEPMVLLRWRVWAALLARVRR
jgi:hypothetical protein